MSITPFSHDTLMLLNIILSVIHIILSALILYFVLYKVDIPSFVLPGFLIISIIACLLILIYSIDCKNMKM
jgi:uncharacterized membrane protein YbhN (UPF0104 family)